MRVRVSKTLTKIGFPRDWFLIPLAAFIGCAAGLAARLYGLMVHFSEHLFFEELGGEEQLQARWWIVLALPVTGAILVGIIKTIFQLQMISHGIPDVIEAAVRRGGRMRLRTGFFTAFNSALTLGSGGSTGQEGPIVLIGAVVGSKIGQWLKVGRAHMSTLIGCGAAAGLAAIFNAPIAGVLLVLEVLLRDFSMRTFMPIVIASVFGVAFAESISSYLLIKGESTGALFLLPDHGYHFTIAESLPYIGLGIACGIIGYLFNRVLFRLENWWSKAGITKALRPASGALALGVMGVAFIYFFPAVVPEYNPPAFFGNGYPVVQKMLDPASYVSTDGLPAMSLSFLVIVCLAKLVGTSLSLGSGGSGGIFAPSLFIGAALGGAFGMVLQSLNLFPEASPATYALAGMAGALAGAVHCPLTAMILVFEITRSYAVIMPVMLVAIVATIVSQILLRESIYGTALRHMGVNIGTMGDLSVLRRITVDKVPLISAAIVHPEEPAQRLIELAATHVTTEFIVCDDDDMYVGMVVEEDMRTTLLDREAIPLLVVGELMHKNLPVVLLQETLETALDKFSLYDVASLPVVSEDEPKKVVGMMTRARLMRTYHDALLEQDGIA